MRSIIALALVALAYVVSAADEAQPISLDWQTRFDPSETYTLPNMACATALLDLEKDYPTPPPQLEYHAFEHDGCLTDVPENMTSEYSSYRDEWKSWSSDHEEEIKSAKAECTDLGDDKFDDIVEQCFEDATTRIGDGIAVSAFMMVALGLAVTVML